MASGEFQRWFKMLQGNSGDVIGVLEEFVAIPRVSMYFRVVSERSSGV